MSDAHDLISVACSECTNQIQRTCEQLHLQASEPLECPACGHR